MSGEYLYESEYPEPTNRQEHAQAKVREFGAYYQALTELEDEGNEDIALEHWFEFCGRSVQLGRDGVAALNAAIVDPLLTDDERIQLAEERTELIRLTRELELRLPEPQSSIIALRMN